MTARQAPKTPASDMASVRADGPNSPTLQVDVGSWVRPSAEDRELVRAGLLRNGARDLADALGLTRGTDTTEEAA